MRHVYLPGNTTLEIQQTLNRLADEVNRSTIVNGYSFVFRPGGVEQGNVYTSWSSLYQALNLVEGDRIVLVDATIAPASVPAGTYDMSNVTLSGTFGTIPTILDLEDGVSLSNLLNITGSLVLNNKSTTTTPIILNSGSILVLNNGAVVQNDLAASQPIIKCPKPIIGVAICFIYCGLGASIGSNNTGIGNKEIEIEVNNVLEIVLDGLGNVCSESLFGAGSAGILLISESSGSNLSYPMTQLGITGVFIVEDLTGSTFGSHVSFYAEQLSDLINKTVMPVGYGPLTLDDNRQCGIYAMNSGFVTRLMIEYIVDNSLLANPSGSTVTFRVEAQSSPPRIIAELPVDATVPIPTELRFIGYRNYGDLIRVTATPSEQLNKPLTDIRCSLL